MRHRPLAFVDLETTGLSPGADRIVEIGIVTVDDGSAEEWTSLVHPGRRVSRIAHSYSGITDDMLADAPRFSQIAGEVPPAMSRIAKEIMNTSAGDSIAGRRTAQHGWHQWWPELNDPLG